jgi:hypothetical protein
MPRITEGEYEEFCNLRERDKVIMSLLQEAANMIDLIGSDLTEEAEGDLLARIEKAL